MKGIVLLLARGWKFDREGWKHPALPGECLNVQDALKVQWLADKKTADRLGKRSRGATVSAGHS